MTITPRHSDITALLTATFMVRIFLKRFSSLLTMNVAPLQGERHGSAVPMVFMP